MRDVSNFRQQMDLLRVELDAAWSAPRRDLDREAAITYKMERLLEGVHPTVTEEQQNRLNALHARGLTPMLATKLMFLATAMVEHDDNSVVIARGRAYAALALTMAFPEASRPHIATMLNAPYHQSYMHGLIWRFRHEIMKWFDDSIFNELLNTVSATACPQGEAQSERPQ